MGGDYIVGRVEEATGARDPFRFAFDELSVDAYFVAKPTPHVLYVTRGLSRARSSIPVAGTQTELTLRVLDTTPVPYAWPAEQLAAMVRDVRVSGNEIAPGHYLRLAGTQPGLSAEADSASVEGYLFVTDPVLGVIDPPTGSVRFTYAVGVTADELEAALAWDPVKLSGVLSEYVPLGITDPKRRSILENPAAKARLTRGAEQDGSSLGAEFAHLLSVDASGRVDLDTQAARSLLRAARYRLSFGRPFALVRGDTWLRLSQDAPFEADAQHVQLTATPELTNELLALFDDTPGVYRLHTAPVEIHVVDPGR